MLGKRLFHQGVLLANLLETCTRLFGIWAALAGRRILVLIVAVALNVVVNLGFRLRFGHLCFGNAGDTLIGIDETRKQIRKTPRRFFILGSVIGVQNRRDGTRQIGQRRHHFTGTLFDPFGDFDFAFTGQKLNRAHFTHIHAYGVSGAAYIAFHGGKGRYGLFRSGLVRGLIRHHQSVFIWRFFSDTYTHVVDHANDVFHLIRVGDILR